MKVLVIRRHALGDTLVSLALCQQLKDAFPDVTIDLVLDPHLCATFKGHSSIDTVVPFEGNNAEHGGLLGQSRYFLRWIRWLRDQQYDVILDLLSTPQTALWTRLSGANVRIGSTRRRMICHYTHVVEDSQPLFAGDHILQWLRPLNIEPSAWTPTPIVSAVPDDECTTIILNPSATWTAKAWPLAHFGELATRLKRPDRRIFVAWGPDEENERDAVIAASNGDATGLPPTSIRALATILAQATLVITTDSGPKHLAVAQGTPTLTLFGSTNPKDWQPPTSGHEWLTHPVDCHPCDQLTCSVSGHPCLAALTPETVAKRAEQMLSRNPE